LDKICGSNHDLFSHIKVPRQRIHVEENTRKHKGTNVTKGNLVQRKDDAPPSSLMDLTMGPKVKTMEGEGVGVRSLTHNTSRVEGRARAPGWD
jgi:hypothetical protein